MYYIKLEFIGQIQGEGYQESADGEQIRLTDLDGNTIDDSGKAYETRILEENAQPAWGLF